jgi:hypothetical protein
MNSRRITTGLFFALALALAAANARAQDHSDKLEGTWLVTATVQDQPSVPPFKVLFTFMPGRSDQEGTLVDTNETELTGSPVCTPDQGVWERRGAREFVATHLTFCFDQTSTPPGNPAGHAKVRDLIKLNKNGEEFTLSQYVEAFDTFGNTVFSARINGRGVRVHAEAPPQ